MTFELAARNERATLALPPRIARADEDATGRFIQFFTGNIRNRNTRAAYARAAGDLPRRSNMPQGDSPQTTSLLLFDSWVTKWPWYDYAQQHPERVPNLLIDPLLSKLAENRPSAD
ncbi:MAG: hypothetical protein ABSH05_00550 [Bryobacteraceae bacterium]|jgi:hypothetical protein